MHSKIRTIASAAFLVLSLFGIAAAGNTTFFTSIGDLIFPISPPSRDGNNTPGNLDNTIIGATTPVAGSFTSVSSTSTTASTITGPTAAQGGAVTVTGGTSTTSANAGGAVASIGGTPGATGVGGAVTNTGGAGIAGAGGASTLVGGAGGGSAAAGGAAVVTGGAGAGSGNGGAVAITGGVAGSTGLGGAVGITAGAPVAGNGSSVTVTASAGAGSTNGGGSVNLVPGAAVSTGAPGTLQINGDANLMCATFYTIGAPAAATDTAFYVATRPLIVVSASEVHAVAAGGASKIQLVKDTGTAAPGAGTDLLTNNTAAGFDLAATANTVQTGTLIATVATKTLAAGDRLSVDFANAIQSSSGIVITACMAPL